MSHCRIKTCAACASIGLLFAAGSEAGPMFMGLGDLPGSNYWSFATDISADGSIVVGISQSGSNPVGFTNEAFRWTESTGMVGLGGLPETGIPSTASGISGDGSTIVGDSTIGNKFGLQGNEAVLWSDGNAAAVLGEYPANVFTRSAVDANFDGSAIIGRMETLNKSEPFYWTESEGIQTLGTLRDNFDISYASAISDDGTVIVGGGYSINGFEAFRWTKPTGYQLLGDLPGGQFNSGAGSTNADGSVIVGSSIGESGREVFRWTEEEGMVGLGDLPGGDFESSGGAISADGSIIVGTGTSAIGDEMFLWTEHDGMRRFVDVLTQDYNLDTSGWTLQYAGGISTDGTTIVGAGINPNGDFEAFIARVPTPSALMLFGLGGLAVLHRRR